MSERIGKLKQALDWIGGQAIEFNETSRTMINETIDTIHAILSESETQKAENERLRGALEDIVLITKIPLGEDYSDMFQQSVQYAREALAPASPQGEETKEENDES